jgi:hypothetical protein
MAFVIGAVWQATGNVAGGATESLKKVCIQCLYVNEDTNSLDAQPRICYSLSFADDKERVEEWANQYCAGADGYSTLISSKMSS